MSEIDSAKQLATMYINEMFGKYRGDTIPPVVFLLNESRKDIQPVSLDMGTEESKNVSAALLRIAVHSLEATTSVFIAESWKATAKPGESMEDMLALPPSERPDREEGVMVMIETKGGEKIGLWVPIHRNPNKLGEPVPMPESEFGGRFAGLFGVANDNGTRH